MVKSYSLLKLLTDQLMDKLSDSDSSVFKDDVVFKYANDEDTIKRLCGLK